MATGKRRSIHTTPRGPGSAPTAAAAATAAAAGAAAGSSGFNSRSGRLNFRPNIMQEDRGGTRPTAAPSSIGLVLVTMFLHVCKKSLLFDTRLKVAVYCGALFVVSLIADVISMPRSYFSRSDNALNQYFVKISWSWLLVVTVPWISMTAHTLGCGRRPILMKHLARMAVATAIWLVTTKMFNHIENNYGRCLTTRDLHLQSKAKCLQAGRFWNGFDISGHAFILVYSSLILAEEASSFVGWEGIKDLVMREEHTRSTPNETSTGPLRNLADPDFQILKKAHTALTPYLRGLFAVMTLHQLLCDVMLVTTMLYYHIMIEKFLGGVIAVIMWFVTYQWLFRLPQAGLLAPGDGLFKYTDIKSYDPPPAKSSTNGTNKFMGLPIRLPGQENIDDDAETPAFNTRIRDS